MSDFEQLQRNLLFQQSVATLMAPLQHVIDAIERSNRAHADLDSIPDEVQTMIGAQTKVAALIESCIDGCTGILRDAFAEGSGAAS